MDQEIVKNLQKGLNIVNKAINDYNQIKQRNLNINYGQGCGENTHYYRKGEEYEAGGRSGKCGNIKDHRRTYLCQDCYQDLQ